VSTARQVARGMTRVLLGVVAAKALDFALYLLLARKLGVAQFGLYNFALSYSLLFSVLADFGVSFVFTREVSRAPLRSRTLLAHAVALKFGLALVTVSATYGVALATGVPRPTLLLITCFVLGMLLNGTAMLFQGLLKAAGRAGGLGLTFFVHSLGGLAAAVILLRSGTGATGAAVAYFVAGMAQLLAAAWLSRDLWRAGSGTPPARIRLGEGLALLRASAPLALSGVFIALYFRIDAVMLKHLQGDEAVGLYAGIYRLLEAFVPLSTAYHAIVFPFMVRAADGVEDSLRVLCRNSLRVQLLAYVGVAVFFTFQARAIVALMLGSAYSSAASGLAILIWALPFSHMAYTMLHVLTAQNRQSATTSAVALTAAVNVALNLILIPRFSFVGAAVATVASEALCFVLLYSTFRLRVPSVGLIGVAWRPLLAGGGLAVCSAFLTPWLPPDLKGLAASAAILPIVYGLLLIGFKALGREDLHLVIDLLPAGLRGRLAGGARP